MLMCKTICCGKCQPVPSTYCAQWSTLYFKNVQKKYKYFKRTFLQEKETLFTAFLFGEVFSKDVVKSISYFCLLGKFTKQSEDSEIFFLNSAKSQRYDFAKVVRG